MQRCFIVVASLCWASLGSAQELLSHTDTAGVQVTTDDAQQPTAESGFTANPAETVHLEGPDLASHERIEEQAMGSGLPAETHRVRGVKSLISGIAILAILFSLAIGSNKYANDEGVMGRFMSKFVSALDRVGTYVDKTSDDLGLGPVMDVLLAGPGPALILSGLVGLIASQKWSKGKGKSNLMLRGLVLVVLAGLVLGGFRVFENVEEADVEEGIVKSLSKHAAAGTGMLGLLLLLSGLGQSLVRSPKLKLRPLMQDTNDLLEETVDANEHQD